MIESPHGVQGGEPIAVKERKLVWAYAFLGVILIAALVAGVDAAMQTCYLASACFLAAGGAATALLTMASIVVVLRKRMAPRLDHTSYGPFVIQSDRCHAAAWASFYVLTALASSLAAIGLITGRIDFDTTTRASWVIAWCTPVLAVLAAATMIYYALGLIRVDHPEARGELDDGRASERLRTLGS